jgi:hypothetical protein
MDFAKAYDCVPGESCGSGCLTLAFEGRYCMPSSPCTDVGVDMSIKLDVGVLDPISTTVGVNGRGAL